MKLKYLILLLYSFQALSNVELKLVLSKSAVVQGELIEANIQVEQTAGQNSLKGLTGKHFAETLFIYSMEPFLLNNGQMESKAKVIFTKIPTTEILQEEIEGNSYIIRWSGLEIRPIDTNEGFKFGSFSIPKSWPVWTILLFLILLSSLLLPIRLYLDRKKEKDRIKKIRETYFSQLQSASTYEQVEAIWYQKDKFHQFLPEIDEHFKDFEKILNKHQFKKERKSHELIEIQEAYNKFKQKIKGVLNGI